MAGGADFIDNGGLLFPCCSIGENIVDDCGEAGVILPLFPSLNNFLLKDWWKVLGLLYSKLFADSKFRNRLLPVSDIGVPNESAWSCKSSHNAALRSGGAASWRALLFCGRPRKLDNRKVQAGLLDITIRRMRKEESKCPRCLRENAHNNWECKNCGTNYCRLCSTEAPGEIGKKREFCHIDMLCLS